MDVPGVTYFDDSLTIMSSSIALQLLFVLMNHLSNFCSSAILGLRSSVKLVDLQQ